MFVAVTIRSFRSNTPAQGDDAVDNAMTPSQQEAKTTDKQINKAVANYRALLEKHSSEFPSEAFQTALGNPELTKNQFAVLCTLVEAVNKTVTRSATVNRTRTPREAMKATGRSLYLNDNVVQAMPVCVGDFEGIFVNLGKNVDVDKLDDELGKLGLELIIDPIGLAALNEAEPAFADKYSNGTQWKDVNGKYCYAVFRQWDDGRYAFVNQDDDYWDGPWWFPCRRK